MQRDYIRRTTSSPSSERLRAWRLYFESALALIDVLDTEMERDGGIPLRWYDVLIHLEETPDGLRMNELADRILYSRFGFARVVDRDGGGRPRPPRPAPRMTAARSSSFSPMRAARRMERARRHHRQGIEEHFSRHLSDPDIKALTRALEKISAHARTSSSRSDPQLGIGRTVKQL